MEAKSTFKITRWDQTVYDEAEPQLGRALVDKAYSGAMVGTSTAELTMCQPSDGAAGYVGTERFTGTLDGKAGTFVLQHGAVMSGDNAEFWGHIVPGSGTGELAGISGTARLEHELITLDHDLG
ncbi:DUF3224 domain-containing protein [Saccharothrix sp. 6-C]|uniref:DUF3224 domain-containing protein n=1 Tax=Saccharothrix sp. 6-C TaxID=2781735 RepID=UPI001916CCAC|nr:DUF3224 domain-containing protein [Saccharothrix sp. 6-C]QQQ77211.1 DUF3224 domain-containing protein [Saccharothrix sp. 6-C]